MSYGVDGGGWLFMVSSVSDVSDEFFFGGVSQVDGVGVFFHVFEVAYAFFGGVGAEVLFGLCMDLYVGECCGLWVECWWVEVCGVYVEFLFLLVQPR